MDNFYIKLAIWAAVIGGLFAFLWKQGHLARLAGYVGATQEELKKCSWPTREELWQTTVLIAIIIGALGVFTVGVDYVILHLVRWLMRG